MFGMGQKVLSRLAFQKKIFFASFPWKQVKVYWLAMMGQNFFDQAKSDNTFWPRPNVLKGSAFIFYSNPTSAVHLQQLKFKLTLNLLYIMSK